MKKNILHSYPLLWIILLTSFSISLSAQEAEFVKLNKAFVLNEDGSQDFRYYKELKLFTHTAMNSTYGETFIVYNPDFQKLTIHACYTKQKDGTIIKAPENAFVEVLPRFAADAPAYNQLKEMVVVHTGLDLGSTIYLDYSIHTKSGYFPALDIDDFLQESSPIRSCQITISIPENRKLNFHLSGTEQKVNEQVAQGKKVFTWNLKNIPASSRAYFLPQNKDDVPRLTANTYENNLQAFNHINRLIKENSSLESETFAQFLTDSCTSEKEKMDRIHQYVVQNISVTPIPFQYTGFQIRGADDVLRSAYGTVIEKTNLLNIMFNAAGIPSKIVCCFPAALYDENTGLSGIKDFYLQTKIDGKVVYLSATSINPLSPELRGDLDVLITLSGEKISISQKPAVFDEQQTLSLDKNKAQNGYIVYDLPLSKGIDRWGMNHLNSQRSDWFEIPSQLKEKTTYTITLPDGVRYAGSTEPVVLNTPQGKFSRTVSLNGNQLTITRIIELNQIQYSPKEYPNVRKLITEWHGTKNRQLLFKAD